MKGHAELARRRMVSQRLWGPPLADAADVVRWLGALQAQEYLVARWSVGQRTKGVDAAAVDRALADGEIVRTHLLRPTWHFVAAADLRWLRPLSAPRVHALNAYYYRKLELDARTFARSNAVLARAVKGERRTRAELTARLDAAGLEARGPRLAYLLMRAELDGVLVSGGLAGKQHTYAAFAERVPARAAMRRDEALGELALRFFAARGPATVKDFALWSSLGVADGRRALEVVGAHLEREVAGARTYWFAPEAGPTPRARTRVDLVQGYDEIVMSYSESKDVLFDESARAERSPYLHAILLDGRLVGHWRPVARGRALAIETQLFRALRRPETHALDEAVARYGAFAGVPVTRVTA